jgi:hypothetical protein
MANADGDPYYIPFMEGGTRLSVVAKDNVNGRFTVKGYGMYWLNNGAELFKKYYAIQFSWVAVA